MKHANPFPGRQRPLRVHSDPGVGELARRAAVCAGWQELDNNPVTKSIKAGTVFQLHKDGSVWQSTGVACIRASFCPGWTELDDNQASVQISVSNGSLAPA